MAILNGGLNSALMMPNCSSQTSAGSHLVLWSRSNTTASAGVRWPCRITNQELYH